LRATQVAHTMPTASVAVPVERSFRHLAPDTATESSTVAITSPDRIGCRRVVDHSLPWIDASRARVHGQSVFRNTGRGRLRADRIQMCRGELFDESPKCDFVGFRAEGPFRNDEAPGTSTDSQEIEIISLGCL
jgi:hypothetical protein